MSHRWNHLNVVAVGAMVASLACGSSRPLSTADSVMTARYQELLREKFSGSDPHAAQQAILCETGRLFAQYGSEHSRGPIHAAADKVLREVPRARQREVDNQLANHVFSADKACDSLARAGVLGGPMPSDRQWMAWDSLQPGR